MNKSADLAILRDVLKRAKRICIAYQVEQHEWDMKLSSCQSRVDLEAVLLEDKTFAPTRITKLLSVVFLKHKNSFGVPLWCRGIENVVSTLH